MTKNKNWTNIIKQTKKISKKKIRQREYNYVYDSAWYNC